MNTLRQNSPKTSFAQRDRLAWVRAGVWPLGTLLAVLHCGIAAAAPAADPKPPRPNVLFLFTDDQRADTIRALGHPTVRTPNLDKLVRRGIVFDRAYCTGSTQPAVCMPSRAMLMSGRSLFRVDAQLKHVTTWPECFGRAGYQTFQTGKWHNGQASLARSFQQARGVFLGGMADPLHVSVRDLEPDGRFSSPHPAPKHAVEYFADEAIDFVRSDHGTSPWLCLVAFNAPHDPCIVPAGYPLHYDPSRIALPENFLPQHPFDNGELDVRDEKLLPRPRQPSAVRRELADYYRAISFIDLQVGRILDALAASGQTGRTIIVYTSDHGLAKGSHGLLGKQNLYEHSMRVPLVIAGPGVPEGKHTRAMCYLFDIFPTLGALGTVSAPAGNEGRSLVPALRDPSAAGRETIFTAYRDVQRAIRDDRWKLIVYPKIAKTQLFDLQSDPDEMKDLTVLPGIAPLVDRLTARLNAARLELGDPLPQK